MPALEALRTVPRIRSHEITRDLSLDHAHQRLLGDGESSVIAIAMACGFSSFGHFARRYRDRFGELPSTTRARRWGAERHPGL